MKEGGKERKDKGNPEGRDLTHEEREGERNAITAIGNGV